MKENKKELNEEVKEEQVEETVEREEVAEETAKEVETVEDVIDENEIKAKEYLERLQRTVAEFDNFRKRTIKEKATMYENGSKEVLEKLLPVIDNFERAIDHIPEEEKEGPMAQGIEMIYKQLLGTITELGVEEIDAKGKEFDTNLHYAVAHEDNPDFGDNEVQEVLQKGYMFKDRVLRHSMVKVVN